MPKGATASDQPKSQAFSFRTWVYASTLTPILIQNGRVPTETSSDMAQDVGDDEDYFAHFEDLEFTEEDLARIDRISEEEPKAPVPEPVLPLSESKGEARVAIEVEQEPQPAPEAVSPPPAISFRSPMPEPPYDAFRSGKSLSVSDLIGPLWCVNLQNSANSIHPLINLHRCELQYEYRQRQGWGLKFKDRPQTFVSREGNTIVASHSIASDNENILKAGRVGFSFEGNARHR